MKSDVRLIFILVEGGDEEPQLKADRSKCE